MESGKKGVGTGKRSAVVTKRSKVGQSGTEEGGGGGIGYLGIREVCLRESQDGLWVQEMNADRRRRGAGKREGKEIERKTRKGRERERRKW